MCCPIRPAGTDYFPSATCGSPAGEGTEKTSSLLDPEGRSDILTSDKLLPFAIWYSNFNWFPWSHQDFCQEYIPRCFMSLCQGQKIMTRHDKLPLRAFFPQETKIWLIEVERETETQGGEGGRERERGGGRRRFYFRNNWTFWEICVFVFCRELEKIPLPYRYAKYEATIRNKLETLALKHKRQVGKIKHRHKKTKKHLFFAFWCVFRWQSSVLFFTSLFMFCLATEVFSFKSVTILVWRVEVWGERGEESVISI